MRSFMVISACLALAKCEEPLTGYEYNAPTAASPTSYTTPGDVTLYSGAPQQSEPQYSHEYESQSQEYARKYQEPSQHNPQQYSQGYQEPIQQYTQQQYSQQRPTAASPTSYTTPGDVTLYSGAPQQSEPQYSHEYESQSQEYAQKYQEPSQQYTQQYSQGYQEPIQQYTQLQYSQQYEQPAQQFTQQYDPQFAQQQLGAEVHKHVYVHVAPQEPEPARVPVVIPAVARPQKHYKIIFVKAPSAPARAPVIVQQQPQNEEKTLIYVLSKEAEQQQTLVLPTPAATEPSKPEVYFIKYNTEKELSNVVSAGSQQNHLEDLDGSSGSAQLDVGGDLESTFGASDLSRLNGFPSSAPVAQPTARYGTPEFH